MQNLNQQLSAAMWSRVLLLWAALGVGAIILAVIAFGLGQFVRDNIREELESQQIFFPTEDRLSDSERAIDGLEENAGEQVLTGDQAQIYSEYIGLHMSEAAEAAGYPDSSYATLGGVQRTLRSDVAAAEEAGDEEALDAAQQELNEVNSLRNTFLTGSNLRGNLLNAYGWDNVALGMTIGGVVLVIFSLIFAGLFVFELRRGHLPPPTLPASE